MYNLAIGNPAELTSFLTDAGGRVWADLEAVGSLVSKGVFLHLEFKEKLLERARNRECCCNALVKTKFWASAWVPELCMSVLIRSSFRLLTSFWKLSAQDKPVSRKEHIPESEVPPWIKVQLNSAPWNFLHLWHLNSEPSEQELLGRPKLTSLSYISSLLHCVTGWFSHLNNQLEFDLCDFLCLFCIYS